MLAQKGRIALEMDVEKRLAEAVERSPAKEAALTHEVVVESGRLRFPHRDPADRLLAATAAVYELTLVTGDERLLALSGLATLANR